MKKILISLLLLSFASFTFAMDPMDESDGGLAIVGSDGQYATVFTISPTLGVWNFTVGLDVNIYVPDNNKPSDSPYVNLTYIEYDDGTNGIKYGKLSNVTMGFGLIMDNYTTAVNGSTMFNPKQAGFQYYTKMLYPVGFSAMRTNSNVNATRLDYTAEELALMGKPIVLGLTYVVDSDGVETAASTVVGHGQSAIAIDAGWFVFGDTGAFFVESGQITNYDSGSQTGFKGQLPLFNYQIDYRTFGEQFVAGYFGPQYETTPVDLSTLNKGTISGYHAGLGFNLLGLVDLQADYEDYQYAGSTDTDQTIRAVAYIKELMGVSGKIIYEQIGLTSNNGANMTFVGMAPAYMLALPIPGKVKITYKRIYTSPTTFEDTQDIGYTFKF
jgi:hypothetical protein